MSKTPEIPKNSDNKGPEKKKSPRIRIRDPLSAYREDFPKNLEKLKTGALNGDWDKATLTRESDLDWREDSYWLDHLINTSLSSIQYSTSILDGRGQLEEVRPDSIKYIDLAVNGYIETAKRRYGPEYEEYSNFVEERLAVNWYSSFSPLARLVNYSPDLVKELRDKFNEEILVGQKRRKPEDVVSKAESSFKTYNELPFDERLSHLISTYASIYALYEDQDDLHLLSEVVIPSIMQKISEGLNEEKLNELDAKEIFRKFVVSATTLSESDFNTVDADIEAIVKRQEDYPELVQLLLSRGDVNG